MDLEDCDDNDDSEPTPCPHCQEVFAAINIILLYIAGTDGTISWEIEALLSKFGWEMHIEEQQELKPH